MARVSVWVARCWGGATATCARAALAVRLHPHRLRPMPAPVPTPAPVPPVPCARPATSRLRTKSVTFALTHGDAKYKVTRQYLPSAGRYRQVTSGRAWGGASSGRVGLGRPERRGPSGAGRNGAGRSGAGRSGAGGRDRKSTRLNSSHV